MQKQRSFVLNNNKENNSFINNMESEDIREEEGYCVSKVLQTNNNICNILSTKNNNIRNIFPIQTALEDHDSRKRERSSVSSNDRYTPHINTHAVSTSNQNNATYSSNGSNGSNGNTSHTNSISSSGIAQQLLNDVRALAAQNQKTEQNLRDLQQKINLQKGKRLSYISQDNKENDEAVPAKPTRNHSYSIQPPTNAVNIANQNFNLKQQNQAITTQINENIHQKLKPPVKPIENNNDIKLNLLKLQQQAAPQLRNGCESKITTEADNMKRHEIIKQTQVAQNDIIIPKETPLDPEAKEETISARLARVLINSTYSLDILNHFKSTEFKTVPKNCLLKHNIPASLRAKMIDWMIEVMKSYKCSEETFFMAVRVMDHFLEKSKKILEIHDLHLIGVTCIFIACKFEEIYPMRLQVIHERIAHKKLSEEQIKSMEVEILTTLNFNLLGTSPYDIAMQTLTLTGYQEKFTCQEFQYGHKICIYLSKMALYDYEFNKTSSYSLLAASVIYIIFKIFQQINFSFTAEHHIKHILQVLKVDSRDLITSSTRILHLAKNFEQYFPDLTNLKKFNGFEMKQNDDFQN